MSRHWVLSYSLLTPFYLSAQATRRYSGAIEKEHSCSSAGSICVSLLQLLQFCSADCVASTTEAHSLTVLEANIQDQGVGRTSSSQGLGRAICFSFFIDPSNLLQPSMSLDGRHLSQRSASIFTFPAVVKKRPETLHWNPCFPVTIYPGSLELRNEGWLRRD